MIENRTTDERAWGLRFVLQVVNDVRDAPGWARACTEHGAAELAHRALDEVALRAAIDEVRDVFALTEMHPAAARINEMLSDPPLPSVLVPLPDGRWALRPDIPPTAGAAELVRALAAFGLARWAADRSRCAWGQCAASGCDRVFLDEGRRAPQRFCSETCATRTRVTEHRRRMAAGSGG